MLNLKVISRSGKEICALTLDKEATFFEYRQLLEPKYYPERQRFTFKGEKQDNIVLKDDDKKLKDYGLQNNMKVVFKDLGPQVSWRFVFMVEYFGPIAIFIAFSLIPQLIYSDKPSAEWCLAQKIGFAMTIIHFAKREYETLFVHRFSNATMPIKRIFINSGHYWVIMGVGTGYFLFHPKYTDPAHSMTRLYIHMILFAFFEIMNFCTHVVLKNLRKRGTKERGIPHGFGFGYVSCANYFWEVCIWANFALLVNTLPSYFFLILSFYQMNDWAQQKHRKYITDFTGKNGVPLYPANRRAIIPFLF